jgi:hypothetical protein
MNHVHTLSVKVFSQSMYDERSYVKVDQDRNRYKTDVVYLC